MNQLSRLVPNDCCSYKNVTDQVVVILYLKGHKYFLWSIPIKKNQAESSDQGNVQTTQMDLLAIHALQKMILQSITH
jgi:hypothetical protein